MSFRLQVEALPAFQDNYLWLVHDGRRALVVDPGASRPVLDWLDRHPARLEAILVTHHHGDHVDGIDALTERFDCPVYGPRREAIDGITHPVDDGDVVALPGWDPTWQVLAVPGHTAGHIAYFGAGHLFCGDTLFACGCGRLFEGTPAQMHDSLTRLSHLPDDTRVCCAHEYTLANLAFARQVDPDNPVLREWQNEARSQRDQGRPTLPSTLAREKAANPFLRVTDPAVIDAAQRWAGHPLDQPVAVFAALRAWKNQA